MAFAGFDPEAIQLLKKLPQYGEAEYKKVKDLLGNGLRQPGIALIREVATRLDADLTTNPRGSVSPFHRDLRFAKAATPRYKDHLMLTAWTGPDKKEAPTLWFRMDADSVGFASGVPFTPEIRDRFRQAVAGKDGEALERALQAIMRKYKKGGVEVAGEKLKKVPQPYPQDHPQAELLKLKGLQIRFKEPLPSSVSKPAFSAWCENRLRDLLPVHEWLVTHVGAG